MVITLLRSAFALLICLVLAVPLGLIGFLALFAPEPSFTVRRADRG